MSTEITASSELADEIASLLVRVYEIHEVIIEVVAYCVAVAEENMRLHRGEAHQHFTIPEIANWLEQLTTPQS